MRTIILVVFVGLFAFSGYKIFSIVKEEQQSKQIINDLQEKAVIENRYDEGKVSEQGAAKETSIEKAEDQCPISVNFDVLKEECQDIVAWIYCPDTPVNYPIVQGPDNQFYLRRMTNGEYNNAGTLFMDFRNEEDFTDKNTIIYGHNMKNDTMFGSLPMYEEQEYYDKHPVMYLLTAEKNYKIELFSSFITSADSDIYSLPTEENNFEAHISDLRENSDFKSNVSIEHGDGIVTLSTCSYEYDVARRVVIGVLKEIG